MVFANSGSSPSAPFYVLLLALLLVGGVLADPADTCEALSPEEDLALPQVLLVQLGADVHQGPVKTPSLPAKLPSHHVPGAAPSQKAVVPPVTLTIQTESHRKAGAPKAMKKRKLGVVHKEYKRNATLMSSAAAAQAALASLLDDKTRKPMRPMNFKNSSAYFLSLLLFALAGAAFVLLLRHNRMVETKIDEEAGCSHFIFHKFDVQGKARPTEPLWVRVARANECN